MSFCSEIKNELADIRLKYCCKSAMIYGFALFSRSFSSKRICMQTENEKAAKCYAKLLTDVYGVEVTITKGGGIRPTFVAEVKNEADRLKILASVDFGIYDGSINFENLQKNCCVSCFVRGAFLACGHLADPEKCYRLDLSIRDRKLAQSLSEILAKHFIETHISTRGNGFTLYIKKSEMISNLLTFMGASFRSLELIESSILKSVKNNQNRGRNCDSANIKRTVEASLKQRKAIEYLKDNAYFESMPSELILAAKLRLEYPDSSLKELCTLSNEPITVSGLNHRLKRIVEFYENVKKRKT